MTRTRSCFSRVLPIVALFYVCGASAAETESQPLFSVNGYGTLGVVHSSDNSADYAATLLKPNGPGYTHDWSADVDSRFGLQITANLTAKLSATLQVLSEQDHDDNYTPTVEWANIKYRFSPDFSVRVGRTVFPVFLFADSRKVGYTYPWVRPPTEMYFPIPVTSSDGLDVAYTMHFGGATNTWQMSYGQVNWESPRDQGKMNKARDTLAIMSTLERGPLTARLSYHHTRLTLPAFEPLFNAFRLFGPEGEAIADRYGANDKRLRYVGVGVNYDPGNWFAMAEWGTFRFDSVVGRHDAWYLSTGYRFGSVTPYASYSRLNVTNGVSPAGLTVSALPPTLAPLASGLNTALRRELSRPAQKTTALGLRWDFMRNMALKLQYEYIRRDDGSPGTFINPQPGFEPGGDAHLFSAAIDFVF